MTSWGLWHAIYALVDAHAKHNRERLMAAVAEQRDKQPRPGEASQQEVATVKVSPPERPESTTNGVDWTQSHKNRRAPHLARTRPGPWPTGLEST